MKRTQLLLVLLVVKLLILGVQPQGRMLEPPSRMSAWRSGFNVPVNYNDHVMNCGSIQNQWGRNGGKCGICGESWSDMMLYERPNGPLVQHNIITKTYAENDVILVAIELTYNQKGWVEFRICDVATSGGIEATQSCLNRTLLADIDRRTRFLIPQGAKGILYYKLFLPEGFKCRHCVLQWKWKTGSSWGCDSTGCGIGHGDVQDEFYACADVAVTPRGVTSIMSALSTSTTTPPSSNVKTTTSTIGTKVPCDGKPANFTRMSVRVEFQKMALGLPNSYNSGCRSPVASSAANLLTASQCVINKDAVDRMCYACNTACQFEVCYVLCPQQCTVYN